MTKEIIREHHFVNNKCVYCGGHYTPTNLLEFTCIAREKYTEEKPRPIPPSIFSTLQDIDFINSRIKELRAQKDAQIANTTEIC